MVNPENSLFRRGYKLGRLGASLTGSYLAYQVQNLLQGAEGAPERHKAFRSKAAKRARNELGHLKGPVMKLGQVLSMMGHTLPEEALKEFAELQGRAPGMHPTLARAQFKGSLGRLPEEVFATFEDTPFAAASLGQVHRATSKDGQALAVKIQYPGIRTAIENDFKLLRSASLPGQFTGHVDPALFAEVERGFLEETDYTIEASNLKRFHAAFKPLKYLRIPEVKEELSSDRVLTMSYLTGKTVDEFLAGKPRQSLRHQIGYRLMETYHFELRVVRSFHADPHPGNFLFSEDGTINLVDFGCVKTCSNELAELIDSLVSGAWRDRPGGFERMAELVCGDADVAQQAAGIQLAHTGIELYEKLFPETVPGRTKVNFGNQEFLFALTDMWNDALQSGITNPEYAFASRAELGLTNLLHRFRAKLDTALIRQRVSEHLAGDRPQLD